MKLWTYFSYHIANNTKYCAGKPTFFISHNKIFPSIEHHCGISYDSLNLARQTSLIDFSDEPSFWLQMTITVKCTKSLCVEFILRTMHLFFLSNKYQFKQIALLISVGVRNEWQITLDDKKPNHNENFDKQ